MLSSWLATAVLLLAWVSQPELSAGSALLMSFTAALVAILVRPDPHRLLTRLLSTVRLLASAVALLSFAAAALVGFTTTPTAHRWLGELFGASLVATVVLSSSWLSAVARRLPDDPHESPWEHRRPRRSKEDRETPHEELARKIEGQKFPYDYAFHRLGFDRPAVRVASCEGARNRLVWSREFSREFDDRLAKLHATAFRPPR
jgi:MFS family permease